MQLLPITLLGLEWISELGSDPQVFFFPPSTLEPRKFLYDAVAEAIRSFYQYSFSLSSLVTELQFYSGYLWVQLEDYDFCK